MPPELLFIGGGGPPKGKIEGPPADKKIYKVPRGRKLMRRGRKSECLGVNKQMFQIVVFSFRNISFLLSSYIPFGTTRVKQLGTERIVCMNA